MLTPAQLSSDLADLGIDRDERVLTDWRQKGLLPPLKKRGLGRGKGTAYVWEEGVTEQAVAAHWLLTRYARTNEALLALWFSGYSISSAKAQQAWVHYLEREQDYRERQATRYVDGFLGLAGSWTRELGRKSVTRGAIHDSTFDFTKDTTEWVYDDDERDDEALQNRIVETINRMFESRRGLPNAELYEVVEAIWNAIDLPKIFRRRESIEFIQSMSGVELDHTHKLLGLLRQMLQRVLSWGGPNNYSEASVMVPIKILRGLVGPFFTKGLIDLNRINLKVPIAETISTLHSFVMSVKLEDVTRSSDGNICISPRVHCEWQTIKDKLSRLWAPDIEESPM